MRAVACTAHLCGHAGHVSKCHNGGWLWHIIRALTMAGYARIYDALIYECLCGVHTHIRIFVYACAYHMDSWTNAKLPGWSHSTSNTSDSRHDTQSRFHAQTLRTKSCTNKCSTPKQKRLSISHQQLRKQHCTHALITSVCPQNHWQDHRGWRKSHRCSQCWHAPVNDRFGATSAMENRIWRHNGYSG